MNELDGDYEFLAESLEMFEEDAPELLSRIRDGLDRNDAEAVWQNAHSIKSMVGNFLPNRLSMLPATSKVWGDKAP